MATNSHENAFALEKERQQEIYNSSIDLISNILRSVMPTLQRVGLTASQSVPIYDSLHMNLGIVESLKTSLGRKKMKVPIFGPTSSGKSMVINAMLGKELLACGMGHTTNCFLMIEQTAGDDSRHDVSSPTHDRRLPSYTESESHFIIRRSSMGQNTSIASPYTVDKRYALDTKVVQDLSDAAADDPLDVSCRIEVFLGDYDHKCSLLRHYLQIVDCPGISTCRDLGDHVKAFCGDADVHVLIVSTESGITSEAKEHFLKVKERMPNPDIIIGFTQWDRSANERPKRKEGVKQNHLKSAFDLFQSIGTVLNMDQVKDRCFFISGKEALDDVLGEQVKYVTDQQERKQAFHNFIKKIEERASEAGKRAKLDTNRQACQHVLQSCIHNIDELKAWISKKTNELVCEIDTIKDTSRRLTTRIQEYNMESQNLRERALIDVEEQLMDSMDFIIMKMRNNLAQTTRKMKASDSDFQEHAVAIVHKWDAHVIDKSQKCTRNVCEDYSRDLLRKYKECFKNFPHEHPKAFIEALHEEILPQVNSNTEPSQERVKSLLHGVTDRGLIAMFATTRGRVSDTDAQNPIGRAESGRMAAGASILFLRFRRWLMEEVDNALLQKFEDERKNRLNEEIKQSCRHAVKEFCDITDAYYNNQVDNALILQHKQAVVDRKNRIKDLYALAETLNGYRHGADEIQRRCGFDGPPEGYEPYYVTIN